MASVGKRGHLADRAQSKQESKKVKGGSGIDKRRKEEIKAGMGSKDHGININISIIKISGKGQLVRFYFSSHLAKKTQEPFKIQ